LFSYCRITVTGDNCVSEGKEENGMKNRKKRERERGGEKKINEIKYETKRGRKRRKQLYSKRKK
jgi:hypothetical protein